MKLLNSIFKNTRAALRAIAVIPAAVLVVATAALQKFVVQPLTGNTTFLPRMIYKGLGHVVGYRVVFNKASAPAVKDKPVWYIANHMSYGDFLVLGGALKGTFAGKGDIKRWPVIGALSESVNYIGLRRSSEYNAESRAKIAENFNAGRNTIMFPEGTTTDGEKVALFRAALLSLLYGDTSVNKEGREVPLKKEVAVQPVAIRVLKAGNEKAEADGRVRNLYSLFNEQSIAKSFWKHMQRPITLEVTLLPAMNPHDYGDAKDLANAAALQIAGIVNPGQTTFEKAQIPGRAVALLPQPGA